MKYLATFLCVLLISTAVICNPTTPRSKSSEESMTGQGTVGSGSVLHGDRQARGLKGALAGAALGAVAGHYAQKNWGGRSGGRGMGSFLGSGIGSGLGSSMGSMIGSG
uniref:Glycine zipper 2TM domain-containing protein n=1 Tax=Plectus sambesii TaxID=2011161 RepID=A0A914VQW5_9BILA